MSNHQLSRRGFLGAAGAATASLAAGSRRADAASTGNVLTVRTQEHYGDIDERLALPEAWETKVYHMAGHRSPVMTPAQIRERLRQPIGTKLLRDLARGKRDAVITFDDLTRPTPTSAILPHVIDELKEGGIPEERILLLTSYGSHAPMRQSEVARKTGANIASRMAWVNHNIWEQVQ